MTAKKAPKARETNTTKKPDPMVFGGLWRVKYKSPKPFLLAMHKMAPECDADAAIYQYMEEGATRRILDVAASDLEVLKKMLRGQGLDVENLYRKALVAYELIRLPESDMKAIREYFKGSTVNSWLRQESLPGYASLNYMRAQLDIDLLQRSVLDGNRPKETTPPKEGSQPLPIGANEIAQTVGGGKTAVEEKPTAPKKAPTKKFHFGNVWQEHHDDLEIYCERTFSRQEADVYCNVVDGDLDSVKEVTVSMLEAMTDKHPRQDIRLMYARALVQDNYVDLHPTQRAQLDEIYSAATVRKWMTQIGSAVPSVDQLAEMYGYGIYLAADSVLPEHDTFPAPKAAPAKASVSEGDEILDLFTQRDLERVTHLAQDFAEITDEGNNGVGYLDLVTAPAFRAMMELWPTTFRHSHESAIDLDADEPQEWWLLETEDFKARVTSKRAEVFVEHACGGYTLYTKTSTLAAAVESVFNYFDVITSEQLGAVLDHVGFENEHVGGVEFDLHRKEEYTPQSFFEAGYGHNTFRIIGNDTRLSAARFLLLAAQTTRGVVVRPVRSDETRFTALEVHVGTSQIDALCLDMSVEANGSRKGAASLVEHADTLSETFKEQAHIHGVFLNERNELELPITNAAREVLHSHNGSADSYMEMVVFI
jgi:hypothetical protein|uniref:Uncharacterized protein n=1 Tax=Myoviridae sp. ctshb19 TaxID=2825194 RepID=A0A8S5UGG5_9CAUD|nr:MAG TPA: hypothetical protein [Myoviridae sp. ctshb19]